MNNEFDIIIIGAGPAGIFCCYELINKKPDLKICLIEKGKSLDNRKCPILENKVDKCINCNSCSIMSGFMGAGAFSDGKYNITTEYGGWLNEYISDDDLIKLMKKVDDINIRMLNRYNKNNNSYNYYNNEIPLYNSYNEKLKIKCLQNNFSLLSGYCRHLGTDNNLKIGKQIYEEIKYKICINFDTEVISFNKGSDDKFYINCNNSTFISNKLIVAPGRVGAEWLKNLCKDLNISITNNQVDIGVRMEIPAETLKEITDEIYELKIKYKTKKYEDIVRTFCMNPNGYVVTENSNGIITVNGHSYDDESLSSNNTNFALLVSNKFTEPFDEPYRYGKSIASFSNMLGNGVIVQRFGDLIRYRRTNEHRLNQNTVIPTLKATPGDLSLVLPKRHLDNIIDMIYQMDNMIPGMANDDNLLYGVETKFYSAKIKLNKQLETSISNLYCIGDGSGWTRSLSYAASSGIYVADNILKG